MSEIQGEIMPNRGRSALEALQPDEFNLHSAMYRLCKPCPFCGGNASPVMDLINTASPFSSKPIYQSTIDCQSAKCGATMRVNTHDRAESQRRVLEMWNRRPEAQ